LKQFIAEYTDSLHGQLIEKDYRVKFNNNPIHKIMANTELTQLISKFGGSRVDVELTEGSEKEISAVRNEVQTLEGEIEKVRSGRQKLIESVKGSLDKEKLLKKMAALVKPFENDEYFTKMKHKLLRKIGVNTDTVLSEVGNMKDNFDQIRKNDQVIFYGKIIDFYLRDVYHFVYTYGKLFLCDKDLLISLCEVFKQTVTDFVKKINEDFKNSVVAFYKNFNVNFDSINNFFTMVEPHVILYRAVRFVNERQHFTINFKFDSPVEVKFSECTYRDIVMMLSTFPKPEIIKTNLGQNNSNFSDFNSAYYFYAFERDLRIYNFFGVKMEEFAYGYLLYDS